MDLVETLNVMRNILCQKRQLDFHAPITHSQIRYYSNPDNTTSRYIHFEIPKKTGGVRKITAPDAKNYKVILLCLNELLKTLYIPSKYAMGFVEGRSVVSNAEMHKNQNYVFNIDLKDFFTSITMVRVVKRLCLNPFNFSNEIASVIAGLCCMKDDNNNYVLPQGAATSPLLTNAVCDDLDRCLAGVAKRFHLNYSRYADDITFSSMHNVYQKDGDFIKELTRIISAQGFTINEKKTRLQKRGSRQEVTGVIVSQKLNVTQNYVRNIRNILYIWEKYSIRDAYSRFLKKYKQEKGYIKKGVPNIINVLDGKLLYLKMIKGDDDSVYQKLRHKFEMLIKRDNIDKYPCSKVDNCEIVYYDPISGKTILTVELGDYPETFLSRGRMKRWGKRRAKHPLLTE